MGERPPGAQRNSKRLKGAAEIASAPGIANWHSKIATWKHQITNCTTSPTGAKKDGIPRTQSAVCTPFAAASLLHAPPAPFQPETPHRHCIVASICQAKNCSQLLFRTFGQIAGFSPLPSPRKAGSLLMLPGSLQGTPKQVSTPLGLVSPRHILLICCFRCKWVLICPHQDIQ